MKINSAAALYFSPTGGTRRIALRLAAGVCESAEDIDLTVRAPEREFSAGDFAVLAVPVFGGRVPAAAAERLRSITAYGACAALVAVYGNRAYEDALLELCDLASARGFRPVAAAAFIARHSIVPEVASGRPDAADLAALDGFARRVRERLELCAGPEGLPAVSVPGSRPYREYGGLPLHPAGSRSKCGKCGKCAAECPTGAISAAAPEKTDAKKCITCMRCVAVCPHYARSLNPVLLAGIRSKLKKSCQERREPEIFM